MLVGWDTETHRFAPGAMAPRLVCHSFSSPAGEAVQLAAEGCETWLGLEAQGDYFVGHNVAYDLAVLCAHDSKFFPIVFRLLEDGRIFDTMIREKMLDIARGRYRGFLAGGFWVALKYNLADVARRRCKIDLTKDTWRMHYDRLDGVPVEQWPSVAYVADGRTLSGADAITYALEDARAPVAVFHAQEKIAQDLAGQGMPDVLSDQAAQVRKAFWLQLISVWGIHTDAKRLQALELHTRAESDRLRSILRDPNGNDDRRARGLPSIQPGDPEYLPPLLRPDRALKSGKRKGLVELGKKDTKTARAYMLWVCRRDGLDVRRTKTYQKKDSDDLATALAKDPLYGISLDAESCDASGDPLLQTYAQLGKIDAVWNKDIKGNFSLWTGVESPIHTSWNTILETYRVSSAKPNIQNVRNFPGVRECFVPRPGCWFLGADFGKLELHCLAEACYSILGWSTLGDALRSGRDPHTELAASFLGTSYGDAERRDAEGDKAARSARKLAKFFNFGLPGGSGAEVLAFLARKSGFPLTIEEVKGYKRKWFETWKEMKSYFEHTNRVVSGSGVVQRVHTGSYRGGCRYTQACNDPFQSLGSTVANEAGWQIVEACYSPGNPLSGCRVVNFVHDEFILEVPQDLALARAAAEEVRRHMSDAGKAWTPRVPVQCGEPVLMRWWSKDARVERAPDGGLGVWPSVA